MGGIATLADSFCRGASFGLGCLSGVGVACGSRVDDDVGCGLWQRCRGGKVHVWV